MLLVVAGVAIAIAPLRLLITFWEAPWDALSVIFVSYHAFVFLMPSAVMLRLRRAGYRDLYLGEGLVCAMVLAALVTSACEGLLDEPAINIMGAVLFGAAIGSPAVLLKIWRPTNWRLWYESAPWQHWCGFGLWAFELVAFVVGLIVDAYVVGQRYYV